MHEQKAFPLEYMIDELVVELCVKSFSLTELLAAVMILKESIIGGFSSSHLGADIFMNKQEICSKRDIHNPDRCVNTPSK